MCCVCVCVCVFVFVGLCASRPLFLRVVWKLLWRVWLCFESLEVVLKSFEEGEIAQHKGVCVCGCASRPLFLRVLDLLQVVLICFGGCFGCFEVV